MADNTHIEWSDATWNPVTGCTRVSAGCDNCYAVRVTRRNAGMGHAKYQGLIEPGKHHFNGVIKLHLETLEKPLRWRRPRKIFVNSMSDLFHRDVPVDFIEQVIEVMRRANWHTFQVLTKRPERAASLTRRHGWDWPPNVWLGTSVEDGYVLRIVRIDRLREVPHVQRFVSFEPLIGYVRAPVLTGISWAIVGGESGPGAREMKEAWVRALLWECRRQGVAFFFKQLGSVWARRVGASTPKGGALEDLPEDLRIREFPELQPQTELF